MEITASKQRGPVPVPGSPARGLRRRPAAEDNTPKWLSGTCLPYLNDVVDAPAWAEAIPRLDQI